jgi:electron transfer flavoprotein alpha/beta subunit
MNIVVCVKAVPDPSIISLDPYTGHIDSNDLVYIVNPYDMVAVEEAVRIKERNGDSQVTLVSVAPPSTERLLHRCLAIGTDEAILIWDKDLNGSDSYATALILAKAIGSLQYDLILCGSRSVDTEAGQVGSIVAEMLDIPIVLRVVAIEVSSDRNKVIVESKLEGGNREQIEVRLPALLAMETALNEPRYASLPALIAGLRKNITKLDLSGLGLFPEQVGLKGSKTRVVSLSVPKPRPKKPFTPDSSLSAAERMRLIMSGGVSQKAKSLFEGSAEELSSKFIQFLNQVDILQRTRR